jgi:hypothetical protein
MYEPMRYLICEDVKEGDVAQQALPVWTVNHLSVV